MDDDDGTVRIEFPAITSTISEWIVMDAQNRTTLKASAFMRACSTSHHPCARTSAEDASVPNPTAATANINRCIWSASRMLYISKSIDGATDDLN